MKGSQKGEIFLSGIIIRWLSQKVMYILSKFICKNSFPALLKCTAGKTQFCWLDAFPVSGLNSCLNSVYLNRRTFLKLLSMKRPTFRLRNEHGRDSKIRTQVHTTKTFILPMSEWLHVLISCKLFSWICIIQINDSLIPPGSEWGGNRVEKPILSNVTKGRKSHQLVSWA